MARRVNPASGMVHADGEEGQAPMEGGSPGVIAPPAAQVEAAAQRQRDALPEVPSKKYMVAREGTATLGGMRTLFRQGKVVDENAYDVNVLRQQGIQLNPIGSGDEAT